MYYNNIAAVSYASEYALSPNNKFIYMKPYGKIGGDCASFLSQCLLAGGSRMQYSNLPWFYQSISSSPYYKCSINWSVASSLYWFLINNSTKNNYGPKGRLLKNISELTLGDLIFFQNSSQKIFHGSIVTSFDGDGTPLISQHTYNGLNVHIKSEYFKDTIYYVRIFI
ncbi:amidase domain-containing protein [Clostridium sp. YIM B02505]|uniref:Amidase domain-containing protein n=1 Tax=Clostridium yunnanense TaxID=2800325 RepID=A0ABS1ER66_9CLOT|nr:amidase domain-containing protein [Clostridium yunnanense]MBK1811856.1 amidase domain-containing protein [Clostridium yunnanense]